MLQTTMQLSTCTHTVYISSALPCTEISISKRDVHIIYKEPWSDRHEMGCKRSRHSAIIWRTNDLLSFSHHLSPILAVKLPFQPKISIFSCRQKLKNCTPEHYCLSQDQPVLVKITDFQITVIFESKLVMLVLSGMERRCIIVNYMYTIIQAKTEQLQLGTLFQDVMPSYWHNFWLAYN